MSAPAFVYSVSVAVASTTWTTAFHTLSQQIQTRFGALDWSVAGQTRTVQYMSVFNGDGRDSAGNINPNLYDIVPSYTRFDVNIGFTLPNKRLRVDAFIWNVTDVVYLTSQITLPDLNSRFFDPPRVRTLAR